eukprot:scaffold927_cov375-Prasinococcus_capsulatus_cf.AAC.17
MPAIESGAMLWLTAGGGVLPDVGSSDDPSPAVPTKDSLPPAYLPVLTECEPVVGQYLTPCEASYTGKISANS